MYVYILCCSINWKEQIIETLGAFRWLYKCITFSRKKVLHPMLPRPQILFLFRSPERVRHWLQADRADWGEPVQHVCLGRVEEQEKAHVRGSERQRQANEGQEDTEKKHGHALPAHSHPIGPIHGKHSLHWENTWNFFLQYQEMSLEGRHYVQ